MTKDFWQVLQTRDSIVINYLLMGDMIQSKHSMHQPSHQIQLEVANISRAFNLNFVVLFGSQASGATHKESDVDIGIYPENGCSDALLEQKFAALFKTSSVDIVNLKTAGPLLQKEIALKGKLLYAKDEKSFPLFQMYAVRAYYDFLPYLHLREQSLSQRIKKLSYE